MTTFISKIMLKIYRCLPEFIVRTLVFSTVGTALAISFIFLSIRPAMRQVRNKLARFNS